MSRAIIGFLMLILVCMFAPIRWLLRLHSAMKTLIIIGFLLYLMACVAGCAAVIDHKPRACYSKAWTVDQMVACTEEHKPWKPGLTDTIAQPVLSAERAIQGRRSN